MQVRAKKSLGQHFLRDKEIAKRIVDLLQPANDEDILEIGPGTGILTELLLDRFGDRLHVVEVDKESVEYLRNHFPALNGRIHSLDFLKFDINSVFPSKLAIIGNFPYNISTQILFRVLEYRDKVSNLVGMFQREVARRITSGPGSKEYGILSVLLEAYFERDYIFTVSENVFIPPPKVKSGVLVLKHRDEQPDGLNHSLFKQLVKAAFNQRRKTLKNSLKQFSVLQGTELPMLKLRPEQLNVDGFMELVKIIESQSFGAHNL